MKALLIAACLAIPVAANAEDPKSGTGTTQPPSTQPSTTGTGSTVKPSEPATMEESALPKDDTFSDAKVINKIHKVNKKHIELGQLGQTRASGDKVRKFGEKLVKDHQRLDKDVLSYAKDHGITVDELAMGTPVGGKADEAATGEAAPGGITSPGNPGGSSATNRSGSQMGTSTPNSYSEPGTSPSGSAYEKSGSSPTAGTQGSTPPPAEPGAPATGTEPKPMDSTTAAVTPSDEFQQQMDELRDLQGTEFDSRFLSNVIDNSDRTVSVLQGWKGLGDKKLDSLIDKSVKLLQDHRKEAQKLQQRVPAA